MYFRFLRSVHRIRIFFGGDAKLQRILRGMPDIFWVNCRCWGRACVARNIESTPIPVGESSQKHILGTNQRRKTPARIAIELFSQKLKPYFPRFLTYISLKRPFYGTSANSDAADSGV